MSTRPIHPKPTRVTSFDVAERAGVNQSTVSRALAGSPQVTAATRERVLAVAKELGYTIDHSATTYLIGPKGKVRDLLKHDASVKQMTEAVRTVLAG